MVLAASFHQDSTIKKGGYAWLNGLTPDLVNQIGDWSSRLIPRESLLRHPHYQFSPDNKNYHIVPDITDMGTFETWAELKLKVPAFCLEAPTPPSPTEEAAFFYHQWLMIVASLPQLR